MEKKIIKIKRLKRWKRFYLFNTGITKRNAPLSEIRGNKIKICFQCKTLNRLKANFCHNCGCYVFETDIQNLEINTKKGKITFKLTNARNK